MNDDAPAEDVVDAGEGEMTVLHVNDGDAVLVCLDVAQVPHVPVGVTRSPVAQLEIFYLFDSGTERARE